MKEKVIFILCLLMTLIPAIQAQDLMKLDLQGARQQALQYNKLLKNSGLAVDKSQQQLREAIAAGLPQISAGADYSNALGAKISIRFDPNAPATEIPIKPQSNFKFQVGQLLFNANYFVGLELAKLGTQLSEKNYEKTEQEILSQVTAGYYLAQVSAELLQLMNKNVENLEEVFRKTEAMVKVGILEQTDLDQLSVQLSALKNGVNTAERQLEMAKNLLRMQIGYTIDTQFELTENLAQVLARTQGAYLGGESFAVGKNIDYQLLEYQEKLAGKQVKMSYASYLPTLSGFYSRTEKILKPDFDMSPKNMVGLQLNIPIFSGGSKTAQLRQAKIDVESMRNSRELLDEQLRIQEKQLQFNLKNAREAYLNQVKNLDVARRVYDNLKLKFEHGMISGLDIVTADNNYVRAETDYISSIYQVLQATVELDRIYGNLKQ